MDARMIGCLDDHKAKIGQACSERIGRFEECRVDGLEGLGDWEDCQDWEVWKSQEGPGGVWAAWQAKGD